jgi:hypothetical protein
MTYPDHTLPGDLDPVPADVCYAPELVALPLGAELAAYLSLATPAQAVLDALDGCCVIAADYELGRLSCALMEADGATPPATVPSPVGRAVLMRAAALWRRRNSVNGFDGFDDLGTVPVRASDPDIERAIDRWRAWSFA